MRNVESITEQFADDVLDGDIAEALAVDPSPEFVARVRQRVSVVSADPGQEAAEVGQVQVDRRRRLAAAQNQYG